MEGKEKCNCERREGNGQKRKVESRKRYRGGGRKFNERGKDFEKTLKKEKIGEKKISKGKEAGSLPSSINQRAGRCPGDLTFREKQPLPGDDRYSAVLRAGTQGAHSWGTQYHSWGQPNREMYRGKTVLKEKQAKTVQSCFIHMYFLLHSDWFGVNKKSKNEPKFFLHSIPLAK